MEQETKKFIVDIINESQNRLIVILNQYNQHICNRFDDLEKRLDLIESRLNLVHKNTEIIPDIFTMLENDGDSIGELSIRVNELEKE